MSEHLYVIFGLPPFEIELKNRKLMVHQQAVKFKAENYSFHLGIIGLFWQSRQEACVFQNLGKIHVQKESNFTARSCQSPQDVENLAANCTRFEKPTNIMARSQRSR